MMVLHLPERDPLPFRPLLGIAGGEIVRMQVADQHLRVNIKQALKVADLLFIVFQGLQVFQVPDVLAEEGVLALGRTETGLLFRAAGKKMPLQPRYRHRLGHIAAGPPCKVFMPVQDPAERVVAAGLDHAVMQQEAVRNAPQRFYRLFIVLLDRGVGEIGTRHDEHVDVIPEQQHMQRRIWQHHADVSVLAEMVVSLASFFQQDDGFAGSGKDFLLGFRERADLPCRFRIPAHDGKGLFIALLSPPKLRGDGRLITAAGQMKAAEALHREDFSGFQCVSRKLDGIPRHGAARRVQIRDLRPAHGAAVRLGVIAAVFNVVILSFTVRAHREGLHGGLRPVIGHVLDDREARSAVGTVDKGVAIPAVGRILQFSKAVSADRDIRRDEGVSLILPLTADDGKGLEAFARNLPACNGFNHRKRRRLGRQIGKETADRLLLPFQLHGHPGGGVPDRPFQPAFTHQAVDERPKAHPLYNSFDFDFCSLHTLPSSVPRSGGIIPQLFIRCHRSLISFCPFGVKYAESADSV